MMRMMMAGAGVLLAITAGAVRADEWSAHNEITESRYSLTSFTKPLKFANGGCIVKVDINPGAELRYTAPAGTSAMVFENGTYYLDIPKGVTLTVIGGAAEGKNGAGAGIEVAPNARLFIVGAGTLNATGGDAAGGQNGADGTDAFLKDADGKIVNTGSWRSDRHIYFHAGRGGAGGYGGGGAGAGIGGRGGNGGAGGAATGDDIVDWWVGFSKFSRNGVNGNPGGNGATGGDCGEVNIVGDVTVNAAGGANELLDTATGGAFSAHDWCKCTNLYATHGGGGGGAAGAAAVRTLAGGGGGAGGSGGGGGSGSTYYRNAGHASGLAQAKMNGLGGDAGKGADDGAKGEKRSGFITFNKVANLKIDSETDFYTDKYPPGNGGAGGNAGVGGANGALLMSASVFRAANVQDGAVVALEVCPIPGWDYAFIEGNSMRLVRFDGSGGIIEQVVPLQMMTSATDKLENGGIYLVRDSVSRGTISVTGSAALILAPSGELTVKGMDGQPAFDFAAGAVLDVLSAGAGRLTAEGGSGSFAFGGAASTDGVRFHDLTGVGGSDAGSLSPLTSPIGTGAGTCRYVCLQQGVSLIVDSPAEGLTCRVLNDKGYEYPTSLSGDGKLIAHVVAGDVIYLAYAAKDGYVLRGYANIAIGKVERDVVVDSTYDLPTATRVVHYKAWDDEEKAVVDKTLTDYTVIEESLLNIQLNGWYVVPAGQTVKLNGLLSISALDDVNIVVEDGATLSVTATGDGEPAINCIQLLGGLDVYGQTPGGGRIIAIGKRGRGSYGICGAVKVHGVEVTACGGPGCAGVSEAFESGEGFGGGVLAGADERSARLYLDDDYLEDADNCRWVRTCNFRTLTLPAPDGWSCVVSNGVNEVEADEDELMGVVRYGIVEGASASVTYDFDPEDFVHYGPNPAVFDCVTEDIEIDEADVPWPRQVETIYMTWENGDPVTNTVWATPLHPSVTNLVDGGWYVVRTYWENTSLSCDGVVNLIIEDGAMLSAESISAGELRIFSPGGSGTVCADEVHGSVTVNGGEFVADELSDPGRLTVNSGMVEVTSVSNATITVNGGSLLDVENITNRLVNAKGETLHSVFIGVPESISDGEAVRPIGLGAYGLLDLFTAGGDILVHLPDGDYTVALKVGVAVYSVSFTVDGEDLEVTMEIVPDTALTSCLWQQDVYTNRFAVMCEMADENAVDAIKLQYWPEKGGVARFCDFAGVENTAGRYIATARVELDGHEGERIGYRAVCVSSVGTNAVEGTDCTLRLWKTGSEDGDFTAVIWGDNQEGLRAGDWNDDPYAAEAAVFNHAMTLKPDFGFSTGDMSTLALYDTELRPLLLERANPILGKYIPYYVSWGNHDWLDIDKIAQPIAKILGWDWFPEGLTPGEETRKYFTNGVKYDEIYSQSTNRVENYYLYRGDCLFLFVDYQTHANDVTMDEAEKWLRSVLGTERARNAKFRLVSIHAPIRSEETGTVSEGADYMNRLGRIFNDYNVDIVFSGHIHCYEHMEVKGDGFIQLTDGGLGYLDHGIALGNDLGDQDKVGGHKHVPYLWRRQALEAAGGRLELGPAESVYQGCIVSYADIKVEGRKLRYTAHGFNANGEYIGAFNRFTLTAREPGAKGALAHSCDEVDVEAGAGAAKAASLPAFKTIGGKDVGTTFHGFLGGMVKIAEAPVTKELWWTFETEGLGREAEEPSAEEKTLPATGMSRKEAEAFCRWIDASGRYRLPTEAELATLLFHDGTKWNETCEPGLVTEWTKTDDPVTGWCRVMGGNALAEPTTYTRLIDRPALATPAAFANYVGFRLVDTEGAADEPQPVAHDVPPPAQGDLTLSGYYKPAAPASNAVGQVVSASGTVTFAGVTFLGSTMTVVSGDRLLHVVGDNDLSRTRLTVDAESPNGVTGIVCAAGTSATIVFGAIDLRGGDDGIGFTIGEGVTVKVVDRVNTTAPGDSLVVDGTLDTAVIETVSKIGDWALDLIGIREAKPLVITGKGVVYTGILRFSRYGKILLDNVRVNFTTKWPLRHEQSEATDVLAWPQLIGKGEVRLGGTTDWTILPTDYYDKDLYVEVTAAGPVNWIFDTADPRDVAKSHVFTFRPGAMEDGESRQSITKVNAGVLRLGGTLLYSGETTVGGGWVIRLPDLETPNSKWVVNGGTVVDEDDFISVPYRAWNPATGAWEDRVCESALPVKDGMTNFVDGVWYAVTGTVSCGSISASGSAHLILCDEAKLTVTGQDRSAGLAVTDGQSIAIYGQTGGSGGLVARGGRNCAGIGGGSRVKGGTVTIHGGTVTAWGGDNGAGIGGGSYGSGGTVTVYGGNVTANGGWGGAGIGGGMDNYVEFDFSNGGKTSIHGGRVMARGGEFGAGIGGGTGGAGALVKIDGGTVTALAGSSEVMDIGRGNYDERRGRSPRGNGSLTIDGGSVMAVRTAKGLAKNSADDKVYRVTVKTEGLKVEKLKIAGLKGYGTNDVYPDAGTVSLWLPNGTHRFVISDSERTYRYCAVVNGVDLVVEPLETEFFVNGRKIGAGSGAGWTYDEDNVLLLDGTGPFVLSGEAVYNEVQIKVAQAGATVVLSNAVVFANGRQALVAEKNVTLLMAGGASFLATTNNAAAVSVATGAMLTVGLDPGANPMESMTGVFNYGTPKTIAGAGAVAVNGGTFFVWADNQAVETTVAFTIGEKEVMKIGKSPEMMTFAESCGDASCVLVGPAVTVTVKPDIPHVTGVTVSNAVETIRGVPVAGGTAYRVMLGDDVFVGYTVEAGFASQSANPLAYPSVENGITVDAGTIRILPTVPYRTWNEKTRQMEDRVCASYTIVATDTPSFDDGRWYVVTGTVNRTGISVLGSAHLILCDGAKLRVQSNGDTAGIRVFSQNSFSVYGQSLGTGELEAIGGDFAAGIGNGGYGLDKVGSVTINGGKVTATGCLGGAGIGGGAGKDGGTVTVNGGMVVAEGSLFAAGIGGGSGMSSPAFGGSFSANGGTVSARGVKYGLYGSRLTVDGGSVQAAVPPNRVKNSMPTNVYCVTVKVPSSDKVGDGKPLAIEGLGGYGTNDIYPLDDMVYLWLPNGNYGFTISDGDRTYAYSAVVDGVDITVWPELPMEPVTPGKPSGPYKTAEEATNVAKRTVLVPSEAVAKALGTGAAIGTYCGRFGFAVTGGDTAWFVEAVLTPEAESNVTESATAAARQLPLAEIAALPAEGTKEVTVESCVPGFYYTLFGAAGIGGLPTTDYGPRLCGADGKVTFGGIAKPSDKAGFFRVGASETEKESVE